MAAKAHDADQLRLQQMGHEQQLKRHFTVWSLIGLASTTTISWTGLGLGMITEINAGGPGAVIYGFILVWVLQCFLGASLAEFVSAYPTEGGMYHWVAAIAPPRHSGFLSFITGWWTVSGWIFTTASTFSDTTNLVWSQNFMALIALYHDDLVLKSWMTFVVYQVSNLATASVVLFGNRIIPAMNKFSLFYLQLAWFVLLVTVAATAPSHNSSQFVFRTWINRTGWTNNAICFVTGLVNPLYSLGGLDGITHITEEMPNPSRNAPLALLCTLTIALVTGLSYLIVLMFSAQDYAALADTSTGLPLAELFRQATQSTGGAFALTFLLWVAIGPCMVGSQLSTSRVVWAFARDRGLPFSGNFARVSKKFDVPVNAQLLVTAVCAALGCLYLGSSTAFNAMLGSAVTINNVAYLIPILTNVLQDRQLPVRGKFHMRHWPGMFVNAITIAWLVFAIVFFSFPYVRPVSAQNMNYTCVCVGGIAILALGWWAYAGRQFEDQMKKAKEDKGAPPGPPEKVVDGEEM
ncbi:putative choline transporter Hnm1 [Auricularia subglabra TFB-10046 SS5]|nr:putative choline transporter Hnm1 [Auricularia subglabra TFB-10046 SS5]